VAGDRKLVLAKTDRVYEVFLCDQCEQQVKSRNIYLCATCDYNFGLCEKCFLTGMRSKEKERELRLHTLLVRVRDRDDIHLGPGRGLEVCDDFLRLVVAALSGPKGECDAF
jgi:hypothetical protein